MKCAHIVPCLVSGKPEDGFPCDKEAVEGGKFCQRHTPEKRPYEMDDAEFESWLRKNRLTGLAAFSAGAKRRRLKGLMGLEIEKDGKAP